MIAHLLFTPIFPRQFVGIHWGQDAAKLGKMAFQTLQTQLENEADPTRTKGVAKLLYKV